MPLNKKKKQTKPNQNTSVLWLVPRYFRYLGGIKDVGFLKHVGTERSRSVYTQPSRNTTA